MSGATLWFADAGMDESYAMRVCLMTLDEGRVVGRRVLDPDEGVVLHADHLADLARVRVDTLREARRVVSAAISDNAGYHSAGEFALVATRALDRLIDAAGGA